MVDELHVLIGFIEFLDRLDGLCILFQGVRGVE